MMTGMQQREERRERRENASSCAHCGLGFEEKQAFQLLDDHNLDLDLDFNLLAVDNLFLLAFFNLSLWRKLHDRVGLDIVIRPGAHYVMIIRKDLGWDR